MTESAGRLPLPTTGTSQDLFSFIVRACQLELRRSGTRLPPKAGRWLEPPLVACGILGARLLEGAPADWALRIHDRAFSSLASPHRYSFDPQAPTLQRARGLISSLEGGEPALLALVSHSPVIGALAHLNFELVRHAMLALRSLRPRPCRPRLVVAIDPFALDTVPFYQEALYAGCMGFYHLGLDRMALSRQALSRFLLRRTSWERFWFRLSGLLGSGGELAMVLAGGVPSTSRILYAVREWLGRERRKKGPRPGEVLGRLRGFADFAAFEATHGGRASVWRLMEAWAMAAAGGLWRGAPGQPSPSESGVLSPQAREVLDSCLQALGLGPRPREESLAALCEEFSRETPYRARFFEVLARRFLGRGRALVLVPVVHRIADGPGIEVKDAWAWEGLSEGSLRARAAFSRAGEWRGSPEEFAVSFVKGNFF